MNYRCWIILLSVVLYGCSKGQKPNTQDREQANSIDTSKQFPATVPEVQAERDEKPTISDRPKSEQPVESVKINPSALTDPMVLAFGPGVERLPAASVKPIPPAGSQVGPRPPSVEEAIGWEIRREEIRTRQIISETLGKSLNNGGFLTGEMLLHRMAMSGVPPTASPEILAAIPFLSLRAARRSIAENPNHPDCYFALYLALTNPELPISDSERTIGQVTALQQCLMRMPPPNQYRERIYRIPASTIAELLASFYYGEYFLQGQRDTRNLLGLPVGDMPALRILLESSYKEGVIGVREQQGRLIVMRLADAIREGRAIDKPCLRAVDLAREMMVLAVKYGERELAAESNEFKKLKDLSEKMEKGLVDANKLFELDKLNGGANMKLADQVRLSLRHHLVGKALELLTEKEVDLQKEFGPDYPEAILVRIALEMATGSVEDVAEDLLQAPALLEASSLHPDAKHNLLKQLQAMTFQKLVFEGNYRDAGKHFDSSNFYWRGVLSLIEGDIPGARKWFLQSLQPGIPEPGVPAQLKENAERYLKLIEKAGDMARK